MCQLKGCASASCGLIAKLFKSLVGGTPDFMPFLVGTSSCRRKTGVTLPHYSQVGHYCVLCLAETEPVCHSSFDYQRELANLMNIRALRAPIAHPTFAAPTWDTMSTTYGIVAWPVLGFQ